MIRLYIVLHLPKILGRVYSLQGGGGGGGLGVRVGVGKEWGDLYNSEKGYWFLLFIMTPVLLVTGICYIW